MSHPQTPQEIPINPKWVALGFGLLALAFLTLKTVVTIAPQEEGVILRLGKANDTLLGPGLHLIIPLVDRVYKVETKPIHKEEFGYRSTKNTSSGTIYSAKDYTDESLRVTGDLNMGEVEWSVQYRIGDPYAYLFRVRDPVETLRDLSESIMCRVIGDRSVYEVLTVGRTEIEVESQKTLQDALDYYGTGLKVVALKLQNVLPPDMVKPSYNSVNEAEQYKEKLINQAQEKYNAIVPKAEGEAKQRFEQSEGYRADRINRALGEANKFLSIYEEYRQAKVVTKKRMYLEAMSEVLSGMDEIVLVDEDLRSILPMLPLDKKGEVIRENK